MSPAASAEDSWRPYIQLTEAEAAFPVHQSDLATRPAWHRGKDRVQAHIPGCFRSTCSGRPWPRVAAKRGWAATRFDSSNPSRRLRRWTTSFPRDPEETRSRHPQRLPQPTHLTSADSARSTRVETPRCAGTGGNVVEARPCHRQDRRRDSSAAQSGMDLYAGRVARIVTQMGASAHWNASRWVTAVPQTRKQ